MNLDTQTYRDLAAFFTGLKGSAYLKTPQLYSRHASIQNALGALAGFFENMAVLAESTESSLLYSMPYTGGQPAGLTTSFKETSLASAALNGKLGSASAGFHYAENEASFNWSDGAVSAKAHVGCAEADGKVTVSVRLWEKGQFSPDLKASGTFSASAVNMSANMKVGNDQISTSADLKGEFGAVYAKASAALSAKGIESEFQAGAALARASCILNLDLLGLKLTLTLTGIAGGVEASGVYNQTLNSWECGLGAAVGIGGSIKLGLSWD